MQDYINEIFFSDNTGIGTKFPKKPIAYLKTKIRSNKEKNYSIVILEIFSANQENNSLIYQAVIYTPAKYKSKLRPLYGQNTSSAS